MAERPVRIAPLDPQDWDEHTRAELESVVPTGAVRRPVHLPAVVARHPRYLAPYLQWAKAIALHGVLSARDKAILALRTAAGCHSEFEWGVHAHTAPERAGLSEAEIHAVAYGPDDRSWSARERALLRAVDELHDAAAVTDETWAALSAFYDEPSLVEIVFVVGHYTMLSFVANSAGVAGEPHWPELPVQHGP